MKSQSPNAKKAQENTNYKLQMTVRLGLRQGLLCWQEMTGHMCVGPTFHNKQ